MSINFNSSASGGDANQDFGDPNNFWTDSGDSIPYGSVPLSTDDVILQENVNTCTGNAVCNNIDGQSQTYGISAFNGNSLTVYGVASNLYWEANTPGSALIGSSGTLQASGVAFAADPSGAINGSNTCRYQVSITENITDDGSGIFSIGTFGNVTYNGTWDNTSAVTFTGTFTATAIATGASFTSTTIVCSDITGGAFTDCTITQSGTIVFTPNSDSGNNLTWTSVTSIYAVSSEINCQFAPSYTAVQYVLTGQTSGGDSGTLTLPTTAQVENGVTYGVGGNGSTGTYTASGGGGNPSVRPGF